MLGVDATLLSMLQARRCPAAAGGMEACRQQLEGRWVLGAVK